MATVFFRTYSPKGDWNGYVLGQGGWEAHSVFQNLVPERGLKRSRSRRVRRRKNDGFFRTYSPKGDWNSCRGSQLLKGVRSRFSEPIPRKGTETRSAGLPPHIDDRCSVFQNLFPERGLKRVCTRLGRWWWLGDVFQNLFPERGLKPSWELTVKHWGNWCFSEPIPRKGTETVHCCTERRKHLCHRFSEPIPRKGTETRGLLLAVRKFWQSSFSEPIPRKGTETVLSFAFRLFFLQSFSEPIPRKGTETHLCR